MLKQSKRVSGRAYLAQLIESGQEQRSKLFVARFLNSTLPQRRYSAVVSRKLAHDAVLRNQLRRQVYEAIRTLERDSLVPESPVFDIVLFARSKIKEVSFEQLQEDLKSLLSKLS